MLNSSNMRYVYKSCSTNRMSVGDTIRSISVFSISTLDETRVVSLIGNRDQKVVQLVVVCVPKLLNMR